MARMALVASIGVGLATFAGACATPAGAPAAQMVTPQQAPSPPARAADPPAVLTGEGELHCTIDARTNGHQRLEITSGGGLEFDAVVSPIVDGTVTTNGPDKGGAYRFMSHLAGPA